MNKIQPLVIAGWLFLGCAHAADLSFINPHGNLEAVTGKPVFMHKLHYRKLYEEKPFPDAVIYYYSNGIYKILSKGENHFGLYVMEGSPDFQTYTIRYISSPSRDWDNKTAYHQLTFMNGNREKLFIQNAITDKGEQIAQQNGEFTVALNDFGKPADSWDDKLK